MSGPRDALELMAVPDISAETVLNTEPTLVNSRPLSQFPELNALLQLHHLNRQSQERLAALEQEIRFLRTQNPGLPAAPPEKPADPEPLALLQRSTDLLNADMGHQAQLRDIHGRIREAAREMERAIPGALKRLMIELPRLDQALGDVETRRDAVQEMIRALSARLDQALREAARAETEARGRDQSYHLNLQELQARLVEASRRAAAAQTELREGKQSLGARIEELQASLKDSLKDSQEEAAESARIADENQRAAADRQDQLSAKIAALEASLRSANARGASLEASLKDAGNRNEQLSQAEALAREELRRSQQAREAEAAQSRELLRDALGKADAVEQAHAAQIAGFQAILKESAEQTAASERAAVENMRKASDREEKLSASIGALESSLAAAQTHGVTLEAALQEARARIELLSQETAAVKGKLGRLREIRDSEAEDMQERLQDAFGRLETAERNHRTEVENLQARLQDAMAKADAAEQAGRQHAELEARLQKDLSDTALTEKSARARLEELQARLRDAAAKADALEQDGRQHAELEARLKSDLNDATLAGQSKGTRLDELQARLRDAVGKSETAEQALRETQETVLRMERDLTAEFEKLQAQLSSKASLLEAAEAQVRAARTRSDEAALRATQAENELRHREEFHRARVNDLEAQIRNLSNQLMVGMNLSSQSTRGIKEAALWAAVGVSSALLLRWMWDLRF